MQSVGKSTCCCTTDLEKAQSEAIHPAWERPLHYPTRTGDRQNMSTQRPVHADDSVSDETPNRQIVPDYETGHH